jgi:hypothetical protein
MNRPNLNRLSPEDEQWCDTHGTRERLTAILESLPAL